MAPPRFRSIYSKTLQVARNISRRRALLTVVFAALFVLPLTVYIRHVNQISASYKLFLDSFDYSIDYGNNSPSLKLRFDWTNLERHSPLAQRLVSMQSNCSTLLTNYIPRGLSGLGSDLHVYSQGLCTALEDGNMRVRTTVPWIWLDLDECAKITTTSAMTCYFPESELLCPNDHNLTSMQESKIEKIQNDICPTVKAEYGIDG